MFVVNCKVVPTDPGRVVYYTVRYVVASTINVVTVFLRRLNNKQLMIYFVALNNGGLNIRPY